MLAEKWTKENKVRQFSQPVSVRLRPMIEVQLRELQGQFPHLTVTQILNDLLEDAIKRLNLPT